MPRLRRLSGHETIAILEQQGFEVTRVRGSHYRLRYEHGGRTCTTTVPVHGGRPLATGTLRAILRQVGACIPAEDLQSHFYTD